MDIVGSNGQHDDNPVILGKEIRPSATAKKRDIPELETRLAGAYPNWFKWHGWCENDLSFQVPIIMDEELFSKYQRLVARGEDTPCAIQQLQKGSRVEGLPENFKQWAKEAINNEDDFINGPYFIKENFHDFAQLQSYIK